MVSDFKLIPDNEYHLTHSGQYCHTYDSKGLTAFKEGVYRFIGQISLDNKSKRNIFYSSSENCRYVMFSISEPHKYAKPVKDRELLEKVIKMEEELKELKKQLK
jgi:hypothetical protein